MSAAASLAILALALITATVSGVFGMAGGLMLMGGLALMLPVNAAFVTHGVLQLASNGWRALLHRRFVDWRIVRFIALGTLLAGLMMAALAVRVSKPVLFILLGLTPVLVWLPRRWLQLDAARPPQALLCGFSVTTLNLIAGVSGPLQDIFFVRTGLSRHQIVATKAAAQAFSHCAKIAVYGAPLLGAPAAGLPPTWIFAACAGLSFAGAILGGQILNRLSDVKFKIWTRWMVTLVGAFYLAQGFRLMFQAS